MLFGTVPAPTSSWTTELQRDGATQMTNVAAGGEGQGPFTVESFIEDRTVGTTPGVLVTVHVSWVDLSQGGRRASVELSTLKY